jgi:predicted transcriptional regulator
MPCVLPDGSVAPVAKRILSTTLQEKSEEEISKLTGMPIYRVRSSIRELLEAGLMEEKGGKYLTTEKGKEKI